jgi:hypothetical protein
MKWNIKQQNTTATKLNFEEYKINADDIHNYYYNWYRYIVDTE